MSKSGSLDEVNQYHKLPRLGFLNMMRSKDQEQSGIHDVLSSRGIRQLPIIFMAG